MWLQFRRQHQKLLVNSAVAIFKTDEAPGVTYLEGPLNRGLTVVCKCPNFIAQTNVMYTVLLLNKAPLFNNYGMQGP